MSITTLEQVLEATGYYPDGQPAPGLHLGEDARAQRRGKDFAPDASWRSPSSLTVYFKFEEKLPQDELVSQWRREIWNEGFAPLLWVISPERIDLYNGFGVPQREGDAQKHLIRTFENVDASLAELEALAGRLAIETGQFWTQASKVDRKTSVDQKLLSDLAALERDLVEADLGRDAAQALIGRVVFTQYLIDRGIVTTSKLKKLGGHTSFPDILRDRDATGLLFNWLSQTFNGDMFPPSSIRNTPAKRHLVRVAEFLEAVDPDSRQTSLFPYQFDVIPVELISSIYEQFAHSGADGGSRRSNAALSNGVHYTRLSVVSLVLDEVMQDLTGEETVLDLTCGSGVFLVEALRRLVHLRAADKPPTREMVRSTLYEQVYGVDISEAAVRVAAFSLYLAALELDPDPRPPRALKFQPLIGRTLFVADARTVEYESGGTLFTSLDGDLKRFDLIVGNPPWSFKGHAGTEARRKTRVAGIPAQPRGEGLDFVLRAIEFSHEKTRFGVILSALPFFSRSGTGMAAALHVMRSLAPITLVNLSNLCSWLFATATMPAVVLFARHRPQRADQVTVVQIPWAASGSKSHTFEVSPSDIIRLSLADIEAQPTKLKAAAIGRRRDIALLDALSSAYSTLGVQFESIDSELNVGLIRGLPKNQTRDGRHLKGLELLEADDIEPFRIPAVLPLFRQTKAQWPRSRDIYRAPILIIKETLSAGPRPIVAVADRDLVYTNAYFGAAMPAADPRIAHLLAAILSSSLASWFFLMSASEFGIWKRRLLRHDVSLMPAPALRDAVKSDAGKKLLKIGSKLQRADPAEADWQNLDDAVFDLYGIDDTDRVVVLDGLYRAGWQWQAGREDSVANVNPAELFDYANTFMDVIGGWLSARNKRHIRAEVLNLSQHSALKVVRFVLDDGSGTATIQTVQADGGLEDVLARISKRMNVRIATALSATRELRIHGRNEVVIIKPAAKRYWMKIVALEDADAVVAESFSGSRA
ncbi:HsdM family class I SAM-dependent methyltransferase [Pseudoxanthomonas suwonensis]|uniref:site-specific DNA-methyltransferase (adenine-specific) n=1 Tax=Pseudoxanthomonas suwonensis TaxID=314722 RepID=A0A0E3UMG9_9GAMM|nr:N-6 DNA methylase [Pseudoxanthomonas suwonensis]AKC86331.1 N-6 DNA methylase [Pseudoxanthomonas suwonensis]